MRRIGVQPRVPEQRTVISGSGDRKREAVHPGAQVSGVSLGDAGDQVGGPRQRQRGREAADDGDDLPLQPDGFRASSIGPLSRPRRETQMCLPAA